MTFRAQEGSFEIVGSLRGLVHRLARVDRDLAGQIRRAASSIALNLAEGSGRAGRDRLHSYRIAQGSTLEVQAGLRLAVAWGYVEETAVAATLARLDDLLRMFTGLLR